MRIQVAPGVFAEPTPELLAKIRRQREANPLSGYFPHEKQRPFHEAIGKRTPIVAFFGGNRSGKTHCSVADDLIQALPEDWVPEHLRPYKRWHPPFHCWIGVPKYAKLEEAIFPKLRALCPPSQFDGGGFDKAYAKTDKLLKFACGSTMGFKTFDQDVDAYSSAALHRMHWDEEPEGEHGYQIRTEARARLIDHAGDEVFSMTPLLGLSFVFEDVYEPWERGEAQNIAVIRADMDDNPHLNQAAKDEFLDALTEEEKDARKSGKFVHMRGLVYAEFEEKHKVPKPDPKHVQGLQTIIGIDPGYRTTGISFIGFDRDNAALVYDELYLHKDEALPEPASHQIKLKIQEWGIKNPRFVIDPKTASNSTLITGEDVAAAYMREGILVSPANNKVEAGILEVKRRLQSKFPALLVSKNCINWLKERGRYRLDDKADGKFEVVKENDHLMDATRYVLMERTWFQPQAPSPRRRASFGENPSFEPPFRPSPKPETSPMGTYT